jgi:hypothetical protein
MPAVTVDLQEGFTGDEVIVRVNGREVKRCPAVRTKRTLGLAESVGLDVPDGPVTLEVAVPAKGVTGTVDLRHSQVGVSVSDSGLHFIQSDQEFGYG